MVISHNLLRMVDQFGQDIVLTKYSDGSYDPSSGSVSGVTSTTYNLQGYFYNNVFGEPSSEYDVGSRKCLIAALGFTGEPEEGDIISGVGDKVRVVSVATIYNAGTKICYICEVRE